MNIVIRLAFEENAAVRLLNWLAGENAIIFSMRAKNGRYKYKGVYQSGVRYQRESSEIWSDWIYTQLAGVEDCDALAAARAGELIARGARALTPADGDAFWHAKRIGNPGTFRAEVFLRTRTRPGEPGMFHCLVRYKVGNRWYVDDPSARLGMYGVPEVPRRVRHAS